MTRTLVIIGLLAASASASFAQTNQPEKTDRQEQPVSSEPETTTATYGAWTLRCTHREQGNGAQRICDVEEAVTPQGQQNPIAQIGIGHFSSHSDMQITAILPTNITFQVSPRVTSQDKDPGVELTWRRCLPGACIADGAIGQNTLRAWRAVAADTGRLLFTNAAGRPIAIQFSFRGFAQAMDALGKERS